MRRAATCLIAFVMLVSACTPAVDKQVFIPTLIGWCADVNRALADVDATDQPRRWAEQIRGLVEQAESEPAPEEDRETLEAMLASFSATADEFDQAADAKERGNATAVQNEVDAGLAKFGETNEIAQRYGMGDLTTCHHRDGSTPSPSADASASTSEAPSETATPAPEPVAAGWRTLPATLSARQHAAAARVGGLVYVAGGIENGTPSRTVEAFEATLGQRRGDIPPLPVALHHAMAVSYDNELVVLGGWRSTGDGDLFGRLSNEVFVLQGDRWDRLPSLQRGRAAGAAVVVDDEIIVVGGRRKGRTIATIEIFDGERWRDGQRIPRRRDSLAAATDGRHVYAVGGRWGSYERNLAFLERYDPATDTWTSLPPMPTARGSIGADIVDGRLVVVGGETVAGALDTVEAFDLASQEWRPFPSLPAPRHGAAVVTVGSRLYTLGGAEGVALSGPTGAVHELTPPPRQLRPAGWDDLGAAPLARQQVATAAVDGIVWVVGGLETVDVATTTVAGLDPETGEWQQAADLPEALHHAMAVNYRDELVVIGGWVPDGSDPVATVSDAVYVLRDDAWEPLGSLNHARAAGAAAVVDDTIVVVGGQADNELVPQTEVYDPSENRWQVVTDMPTPREHVAAAAIAGHVYVVGGRTPDGPETNFATLERYDPVADDWQTMEPMPTARGSIAATEIDGRLVVVGGETSSGALNTVEMYDVASDTWTSAPDLPQARHGTGVAAVGSLVCVIGGAQSIGHVDSSTAVDVLKFE